MHEDVPVEEGNDACQEHNLNFCRPVVENNGQDIVRSGHLSDILDSRAANFFVSGSGRY